MDNRPVLLPGLDVYFAAYNDLSFDRPVGIEAGYIPWSSMIKWCKLHGIHDINEVTTFVRYLRAMERADFAFNEKKKAKNGNNRR